MRQRNHRLVIGLLTCILAGCASAQTNAPEGASPSQGNPAPVAPAGPGPQTPSPQTKNPLPADAPVDRILDALHERGQNLRSFSADVTLAETVAAAGATTTRTGKAYYQVRPGGDARMRVSFTMLTTENGENRPRRLEYVLDGQNLIERNYETKTQITRQVLKPGEKINLLKLGEGPFPLPIGQERAEVLKQFNVQKVEPKSDEQDSLHVILTPVPNTPFAKQFQTIDVWVDRNTHWPKKISTTDPNQTTERTTELKQVEVNPELTDKDFDLGPLPDGWNRQDEQFQQ